MGRKRRREAYGEKRSNLWPHQWSKIPRYWPEDLEKYMQKILIYYPKNLRALKPIAGEASTMLAWLAKKRGYGDEEEKIARMETLYMQIFAKYKRSYIRHQNIDICYQDPYTYRPNNFETLRLYQSERRKLSIPQVLRRSLRLSKNIKHLEIDGLVACCDDVLESIRNIPSLESLFIGNVKDMSLEAFEKSVCSSKATLKTITITGVLKVNPLKLFRILTALPKLRTVNLEVEFPAKFDVRQIPYKLFRERDIQFNIRLRHYLKGEVKFATEDRLGIAPVDYLGLNYKQLHPAYWSAWDARSEERRELQENSKRVLILNFPLEKQWRILKLLRACKQVKTLDIGLRRGASWNGNEFVNLKYLKNLKHVFITLDNTIPGSFWNDPTWKAKAMPGDGLFRNLAACASTLRFISLHIAGEIEIKDDIALLFKLCSNTLTHFTLKFTCGHGDETSKMKNLYTYLQELKQLISLKIIYVHFSSTRLGVHAKKMPFTCTTLKEISLTAPAYIDQLNLEFQHLTNLEKIQLCVRTLDDDSILFKNKFVIPDSVKHIEFHTNEFSEKLWHKLLVQFNNLPLLEILMLKMRCLTDYSTNQNLPNQIFKQIKEQMRINDIKILFKGHRNLKSVVYGYGFDLDTVNVFVEDVVCCSDEDVDNFFGRCECATPRKRMQRVFKVRKEIIEEEAVVNKASKEENRGFKGFFKNMFLNLKSYYDTSNG